VAQAPAEELPPGEVDLSRVEIPTELTAPGAEADLVDAAAPVGAKRKVMAPRPRKAPVKAE
jgi:hypothetical protein